MICRFAGFNFVYILPANGKEQFFQIINQDGGQSSGGPQIDWKIAV